MSQAARYRAWVIFFTFQIIHDEFMVKSRGGTDSSGIKWKELSKRTIAYRPTSRGDSKRYGFRNYMGSRGLLTPSQEKRWQAIFAYNIRRGKDAKEAAKLAWGILKSQGAKTKIEVLGGREVSIQIITHRLEMSLRPGKVVGDQYIPSNEQFYRIEGTSLIVGTTVPYSQRLHEERPLFPSDITPWINRAKTLAKAKVGLR